MRRAVIKGLLAIAAVAVVTPAAAAQGRTPVTDPLHSGTDNGSITVPIQAADPSTGGCGFPIDVAVSVNHEYQNVVTLADGTTVTGISGELILVFTNDNTGYAITRDVSGPTIEIDHPDGTGTFAGAGKNWNIFGPTSRHNTGEPELVFSDGLFKLNFETLASGARASTSFALAGRQVNGCKLLAH